MEGNLSIFWQNSLELDSVWQRINFIKSRIGLSNFQKKKTCSVFWATQIGSILRFCKILNTNSMLLLPCIFLLLSGSCFSWSARRELVFSCLADYICLQTLRLALWEVCGREGATREGVKGLACTTTAPSQWRWCSRQRRRLQRTPSRRRGSLEEVDLGQGRRPERQKCIIQWWIFNA